MKSQQPGNISPVQALATDDGHPAANAVKNAIRKALSSLGLSDRVTGDMPLEHPADPTHGDYASPIALVAAKRLKKNPRDLAVKIAAAVSDARIAKAEAAGPGFINIWLTDDFVLEQVAQAKKGTMLPILSGRKIMIEFAHPNTHKEFHIGHLRNISIGESLVRILEANGATVFRANYEGDVGMHVAKAIWGVQKKLSAGSIQLSDMTKDMTPGEKAKFLGEGYALGSKLFEEDEMAKKEIIELNKTIYKDPQTAPLWKETRQMSLDYFNAVYARLGTKFDRFFFESEVEKRGRQLVIDGVEKGIFVKDKDGSIYFPGEKVGLNNCVFVTRETYATYEGKDVALEQLEYETFPFDLDIHIVTHEQINFFQLAFAALEQLFPHQKGRQYHLAYGMVNLKSGKMSSRTGQVITADSLIDQAKEKLSATFKGLTLQGADTETIAVAAVKYAMLRVNPKQDIAFDLNQSVTLEGDSGPYLLYVYARCRSVLRKAGEKGILNPKSKILHQKLAPEESLVLRTLSRFPEVVADAAKMLSPNLICAYLFDLAATYNGFYNKHQILDKPESGFRLFLTDATAEVIKQGLDLLGINTVERM